MSAVGVSPPGCNEPGLRIFDRGLPGGGLRLVVRKATSFPTALRLTATFKNLVPNRPLPLLVTLPAAGEYPLVDFHFASPGSPWHCDWHHDFISGWLNAVHDPDAVYELPWTPGEVHALVQGPHNSASWYSGGCALDFAMPEGTPVRAAREGVVAGFQDECSKAGGAGTPSNFVVIQHADRTLGAYEHLKRDGVAVRVGQRVRAGALVGYSGNTGASTGPHLHFAVLSVLPDITWAPQHLRFRVAGESGPIELVQGRIYKSHVPSRMGVGFQHSTTMCQ